MKVMTLLIQFGADLDARDNTNWTPLHYVALVGTFEVIELLLIKLSYIFNFVHYYYYYYMCVLVRKEEGAFSTINNFICNNASSSFVFFLI
jgi:ankyrin repeat protein